MLETTQGRDAEELCLFGGPLELEEPSPAEPASSHSAVPGPSRREDEVAHDPGWTTNAIPLAKTVWYVPDQYQSDQEESNVMITKLRVTCHTVLGAALVCGWTWTQ